MKPFTTLAKIREKNPCEDGWKKLTKSLGGVRKYGNDTPITIRQIIESNNLDDALWCLRTMPEHDNLWRNFAVDCAEQVKHLLTDKRSIDALVIARSHANGTATDAQLAAARDAAWAAAWAAWAAWDAGDAAGAAARAAARDAWAAAWAAAGDAAREWQKNRLLFLCEQE